MRFFVSLALAGSAFFLSACSNIGGITESRPNEGPCPAAGSLYEAQRVVMLNGEGEKYTDIKYTGEINGVKLYCRYVDGNPIQAQVDIDFAFGKGAAATSDIANYQFFVAVTRTNRAVIEKQVFPLEVKFPKGSDTTTRRETVGRIVIPRADSTISGANFEVLVGFELTPEQRAFNENGRRYLLQTR